MTESAFFAIIGGKYWVFRQSKH